MSQRLAAQIQEQLKSLVDQYDARLRAVPGYANLPQAARRDLEQRVLQLIAECLEADDDSQLIQYIRARAEQVLTHGFQPEWFQQAVIIPQDIITPLIKTVAESNFVWRALGQAQTTAWEIVAHERRRAEQTLRESEARYQTIFDATPIMFWLKDTHNRTLRINKAAAELEGVKPAEVEGKSAYDLYPREQAEAFYQDDLEVIRSNQPKLGIVEQHTSVGTGKLMWVETGKTPVHDEQGEAIGVLAFGIDVTERKQAEETLRQSAAQQERVTQYLRATIEATYELTHVQDLDTLYRRTVELARERFDVERCGLFLLDESEQIMLGTYGTNDQRRTTDERGVRRPASEFEEVLSAQQDQLWVVRETSHVYNEDGVQHTVGAGWVVNTVLRGVAGPIGILFNDRALSGRPVDTAQQEALAVYCSAAGSIIERKRIEEQVRESLDRRGVQVQISTEVAQEIASATDLNELFKRVVTLIKERFNYYHTQLFRYEPAQEAVVLITGYGEIGQTMLDAGHQLQMGRGVVGTAAATGQSILASDVRQDADWRPNPHLPQTRGELAVPIKWRDQVLGILDVQSDRAGALSDDDRLLLEGLCGQIASAIEHRQTEDRLAEERNLIRTLIDTVPDLIYAKDRDSRFILANLATAQRMGAAAPQDLIGKSDLDFYPSDLAQQYLASEQLIIQEGQSLSDIEDRAVDAAGQPRWHRSTKVPLRDPEGRIIGLVGITSDITARKQVEFDLRKFKLGLDRSTAAIFITDPNGIITYTNPAFEKVYGFTQDEALGQTPRILKSGLIPQEQYQNFWGALLAGQTVAGEIVNKAKDGRLVPVQGSNSAIKDEQGNILGFLALHNDITERKQVEQEFSRFKQGLEQASDAVFMTDVEGHISYVNPAFERIYGYSRAEVIGQTPRILKSGQLSQEFYQSFWQALLNKQSVSGEKPNKTKDGRVIIIEDSNSPILDSSGNLLGFLSTHRDITERKQAEQRMTETLHETERLYAAVGHESWQAYRQTGQLGEGYIFNQAVIQPADEVWEPEIAQSLEQQALITSRSGQRAVAVSPLAVRGEAIGALGVYDDPAHPLSKDDLQLIEAVAEQVALALESARLFDQNQRDAEREHVINRVTSRIRNARSVDEVLSIAAQELRLATRASRSVVEILPATDQPVSAGNGEGVKA